jgi:hypothetical protein
MSEQRVRATVNYVLDGAGRPLQLVTEDESQTTMRTHATEVWIDDLRGQATDLDREGFVLVPHESALADFGRIEEDPDVDARYGEEMAALLRGLTGATQVVLLGGGKKRFGEAATDELAPLKNAKPARYAHADNTDRSATAMVRAMASVLDGVDLEGASRWALYNLWRAVSPPPQDTPLAVCDARTVAPDDELVVTAITVERGIPEVRHDTTGYRSNPAHRWCWFRDMTRDEVLVFKAHDSDRDRPRRVPHTAFDDPSCPAGTPPRASVEVRALALFA